jgi:outer membrane lipase/esterase
LLLSVGALCSSSGYADLTLVPGLNVPQASSAAAVQQVCGPLVAFGGGPTSTGAGTLATLEQVDLRNVCRSMVQTSNAQQPQGAGPTMFSLGISEAELRQALQGVADEEAAAQGRGSGESPGSPSGALRARLSALRAAGSSGKLAGFQFNGNNVARAGSLREQRGGGAAADPSGRLGAFVNASYYSGDRDASSREDEFDFDSWGLVGGVDYRFRNDLVGGIALNYSQTDVDIETAPGGKVDTDTYGVSLYGTYYKGAFYLDGHFNYSRAEYDNERRIVIPSNTSVPPVNRTAKSDPDADQITLGLGAGYNVQRGASTFTPYGRLEYLYLDIDGYTERGAIGLDLQVDGHSLTSFQSALGAQLAYAISTRTGVFSPQVFIEWNHEFENGSRSITSRYVNDPFNLSTFTIPTDSPDRDFLTIGVGVSGVFQRGVQGFVNLETVEGLSNVDVWGVIAGVRLEL